MNAYPAYIPDLTKTPAAWTAALRKAVDAGKIPNIPPSMNAGGSPQYPAGTDPAGPAVCSGYPQWKCRGQGEVWDAPDNSIGIGCVLFLSPLPRRRIEVLTH
jgi:chitin deacetylase